jgi:hypothetical protein
VLDDLTPLRQLAASVKQPATETRLFPPRSTVRFGRLHGFGAKPEPGQNYGFVGGMIPSFDVEKTPDGEEKVHYLDAGENLPDGVLVFYQLAAKPDEPVRLTFLDAEGKELRTVRSRTPEEIKQEEKERKESFPKPEADAEEPDRDPFVPARAGLNRFVWDARLPPATQIGTKGGAKPDRSGPRVPPGEYQVRLTVDGQSFTERFRIEPDARVDVSPADMAAQHELRSQIHETHDALNRAVNEIRRIKRQAESWARWTAGTDDAQAIADAAKALNDKLAAIEGELIQEKIQSVQDELNYPVKLNNKLAVLGGVVETGASAPTQPQRELYADLKAAVDAQLAALEDLNRTDVATFNELIAKHQVPPVGSSEETTKTG